MHLLIYTYFDIDGLLTWIDVSEQQVSYRSLWRHETVCESFCEGVGFSWPESEEQRCQRGQSLEAMMEWNLTDLFSSNICWREKNIYILVRKTYERKFNGKTLHRKIWPFTFRIVKREDATSLGGFLPFSLETCQRSNHTVRSYESHVLKS